MLEQARCDTHDTLVTTPRDMSCRDATSGLWAYAYNVHACECVGNYNREK